MRRFLAILVCILAGAAPAAGPAVAATTWDGIWVGDAPDATSGVQLIFVGNDLIGFFWNGDYLDMRASLSTADGVVTVTWTRGQAILTRDGPRAAHLQVFQRGLADMTVLVMPED
jgi:hypothetical protein